MGKFVLVQTCEGQINSVGCREVTLYIILIDGGGWKVKESMKGRIIWKHLGGGGSAGGSTEAGG